MAGLSEIAYRLADMEFDESLKNYLSELEANPSIVTQASMVSTLLKGMEGSVPRGVRVTDRKDRPNIFYYRDLKQLLSETMDIVQESKQHFPWYAMPKFTNSAGSLNLKDFQKTLVVVMDPAFALGSERNKKIHGTWEQAHAYHAANKKDIQTEHAIQDGNIWDLFKPRSRSHLSHEKPQNQESPRSIIGITQGRVLTTVKTLQISECWQKNELQETP